MHDISQTTARTCPCPREGTLTLMNLFEAAVAPKPLTLSVECSILAE